MRIDRIALLIGAGARCSVTGSSALAGHGRRDRAGIYQQSYQGGSGCPQGSRWKPGRQQGKAQKLKTG